MKTRLHIWFTALLLLCIPAQAQTNETEGIRLSNGAFASLLTCGPGNDFYTSFGHTALRICDSAQGIDVVYNYGTFDFEEPHFYLHFAQGHLNYFLGRTSFQSFMMEYAFEGRSIYEQRLLLTHKETNRLFRLLENNYMPENKHYMYDYFADNCATRARNMIDSALIGRTLFATPSALTTQPTCLKTEVKDGNGLTVDLTGNLTFRQMLSTYTQTNLLWWQFGIDLLLGARCDKPIATIDYTFSPYDLRYQTDSATTTWLPNFGNDSASRSLVDSASTFFFDTASGMLRPHLPIAGEEHQILRESKAPLHKSFSPVTAAWLLAAAVLIADALSLWRRKHNYDHGGTVGTTYRLNWIDGILFGLTAAVSLLLLFMWFCTDHYWTKANWNLLWANPLFLVLLLRLRKSNRAVAAVILLCLTAAMALGCTGVLPQHYNAAVLPICVLLFVRTLCRMKKQ